MGGGTLRARSNWRHAVAVTLPIVGESKNLELRVSGPFLESPENVSGLKSCFMLAVFAFKIKVSMTLKMISRKYQLTKQN